MTTSSRPRGVMLLIADDWSPIARCYGNDVIKMPVVDEAASQGVVFTQAFCTTPSCAASRASILTGKHSHAHGQYGHCHGRHTFRTLPSVRTLPSILAENGIASGAIGKQHVLPKDVYPWDFEACEDRPRDYRAMRQEASEFLDQTQGRSFYLHIGCGDPHRSSKGFGDEFEYEGLPKVEYSGDEVIVPPFLPDCPEVREELASYYAALSRLDSAYGMMIEALRESGRDKDTLIIMMSDHGMPFPAAKASSFDTGHHCPLIVISPQQRNKGIKNYALVNWTDIMPTVLEWLGVEMPKDIHGRSLLPILEQENPDGWDETTFSHSFHEVTNYYPYRVIRERRYKYVLNLFPELTLPLPSDIFNSKTWQVVERDKLDKMGRRATADVLYQDREKLYDIENDPYETTNLVKQPELSPVVEQFRQKMAQFRKDTDDFWLIADTQSHLRDYFR